MNVKYYTCKICSEHFYSGRFGSHLIKEHGISSQEYYDSYINPEARKDCEICSKPVKFKGLSYGYQTVCSRRCTSIRTSRMYPTLMSDNGKLVHKIYPNLTKEWIANLKITHPTLQRDNGVKVMKMSPNQASEMGKKSILKGNGWKLYHKLNPGAASKNGELSQLNNPGLLSKSMISFFKTKCPCTGLFPYEKALFDNTEFKKLNFLHGKRVYYNGKRYLKPDFINFEKKVVVEVDGSIHRLRIEEDKYKDTVFASLGFRVFRVTNDRVKFDLVGVINEIKEFISDSSSTTIPNGSTLK